MDPVGQSNSYATCNACEQVAVFMFSFAVLAHSAKNKVASFAIFALLEGVFGILQFPLSCVAVAVARGAFPPGAPRSTKTN